MNTLVIAEHDNVALSDSTLPTVTAAARWLAKAGAGAIHVLVAGHQARPVADAAAHIAGVDRVLLADDAAYAQGLAEPLSLLIAGLGRAYDVVLAPATAFGKNMLPRVAAMLDVAQVGDVVEIAAADTFVRPIYAGSALATIRSLDPVKVISVRTTAFAPAIARDGAAIIETIAAAGDPALSRVVERRISRSRERPELTSARVIISGGRGMAGGESFKLLEAVADRLGAAVGASRAAVDSGYVPNDFQVGQTGKIVAPDLYIAAGISGAIQHLAGMKDSKVIVAINKDEEAPIFQVADYGLVADLFQALPELAAELSK
jgi:electron transfer flavoprotein alpha subunit